MPFSTPTFPPRSGTPREQEREELDDEDDDEDDEGPLGLQTAVGDDAAAAEAVATPGSEVVSDTR